MKKQVVFVMWNREYLVLVERRRGGSCNGLQLYPGGAVEPGEDLVDALRREVYEELGVKVGGYYPLPIRPIYTNQGRRIHPFLIFDYEGEIPYRVLDSGDYLDWIDPTLMIDHPLESQRVITEKLLLL